MLTFSFPSILFYHRQKVTGNLGSFFLECHEYCLFVKVLNNLFLTITANVFASNCF